MHLTLNSTLPLTIRSRPVTGKPEFILADHPAYIVQRGHSREPVYSKNSDYRACLDWFTEAAGHHEYATYAYNYMIHRI